MTLGTNVPMGPLTLADHIGLDLSGRLRDAVRGAG